MEWRWFEINSLNKHKEENKLLLLPFLLSYIVDYLLGNEYNLSQTISYFRQKYEPWHHHTSWDSWPSTCVIHLSGFIFFQISPILSQKIITLMRTIIWSHCFTQINNGLQQIRISQSCLAVSLADCVVGTWKWFA